eukprot:2453173-Rhodomonas_salina.3
MLQIQLAAAFDRYVEAVQQKVEKKNMCMQVIGRLMHRNLSISWDLYCEAVDRSREEKEIAAEKQRIEAEHDREQVRLPLSRSVIDPRAISCADLIHMCEKRDSIKASSHLRAAPAEATRRREEEGRGGRKQDEGGA